MFVNQLGYRHTDGSLRGYVGYGFTSSTSEEDTIRKIRVQCIEMHETYNAHFMVKTRGGCRHGEFKALQRQWEAIRKAAKDKGASIY